MGDVGCICAHERVMLCDECVVKMGAEYQVLTTFVCVVQGRVAALAPTQHNQHLQPGPH